MRGRPPQHPDLFKIPVSYKLPRWLVKWLRDQDRPQAQVIEEALVQRYKLKAPAKE